MVRKSKPRSRVDIFMESLRSEITAAHAGLDAWLRHLEAAGGIEPLFELEAWLRGLRAFMSPEHCPIRESERASPQDKDFRPELRVIHQALQRCELCALRVIRLGQPENLRFETLSEKRSRAVEMPGYNTRFVFEQPTPLDSLTALQDSLNDVRLLAGGMTQTGSAGYQVYRSLGKCFRSEIAGCRYIEMLLSQRVCQQYDQMDNPHLRSVLDGIEDERLKRNSALAFIFMHRLLKYLGIVAREMESDHPLRETLVLFALLHEEVGNLADFLKSRFLTGRAANQVLRESLELIVYSLRVEGRRIYEKELASVASSNDAALIFGRVQNSHGLLRNSLESGVVALAQALNRRVEAKNVYPSMMDDAKRAQALRQDLWDLRVFLKDMLESRKDPALDAIVDRMSVFREKSLPLLMYRDWSEFEGFHEGIVIAASSMECRLLLRKFVSYLETLIQEVSKRSSLRQTEADGATGQ